MPNGQKIGMRHEATASLSAGLVQDPHCLTEGSNSYSIFQVESSKSFALQSEHPKQMATMPRIVQPAGEALISDLNHATNVPFRLILFNDLRSRICIQWYPVQQEHRWLTKHFWKITSNNIKN